MEKQQHIGLQKRNDKISVLKYILSQSRTKDSPFTYDILDDLKYEKSFKEDSHNKFNILDGEKEFNCIIGITLYNESYSELESTLISIFKNRAHEETNGMHCLSKSLVIIVADGYENLDSRIKEKFEYFLLFDESKFLDEKKNRFKAAFEKQESQQTSKNKEKIDDAENKEEQIFDDTTFLFQGELAYTENGLAVPADESPIDSSKIIKLVFAVKYQNKGKLHSHLLLLMLFCRKIKPNYVIVITI